MGNLWYRLNVYFYAYICMCGIVYIYMHVCIIHVYYVCVYLAILVHRGK